MNQTHAFQGIVPALVTPYTATGSVDYAQIKRLVRFLIRRGADGFYVAGSTGEAFLMSLDERKKVLETVVEEVNGERFVIAHIGAIATDTAVSLARHAQEAGSDAVSAISPFYYPFTQEEVIGYYQDIMQSTDLPMFIYNFPAYSNFSLTETALDKLRECEPLKGVKFTSSDLFFMERIKTKHPELVVWNGYDEMLLSGLAAGADGGIGSSYNCILPLYRHLFQNFQQGNLSAAQADQRYANDLITVICKYDVIASVKYLLDIQGFQLHGCRKPFIPLSSSAKEELRRVWETLTAENPCLRD